MDNEIKYSLGNKFPVAIKIDDAWLLLIFAYSFLNKYTDHQLIFATHGDLQSSYIMLFPRIQLQL